MLISSSGDIETRSFATETIVYPSRNRFHSYSTIQIDHSRLSPVRHRNPIRSNPRLQELVHAVHVLAALVTGRMTPSLWPLVLVVLREPLMPESSHQSTNDLVRLAYVDLVVCRPMHDEGGREFASGERLCNAPLVVRRIAFRACADVQTQHFRKIAAVEHVCVDRLSGRILPVTVVVNVVGLDRAVGSKKLLQKAYCGVFFHVAMVDRAPEVFGGEERSQRIGDGVEGKHCSRLGDDVKTSEQRQVSASSTASDGDAVAIDGAPREPGGKTERVAEEIDAVFDVDVDFLDAHLRSEAIVGRDEGVVEPADAIEQVFRDVPTGTFDGATIAMEVEEDRRVLRVLGAVDAKLEFERFDVLEGHGIAEKGHFDGDRGFCWSRGGVGGVRCGCDAIAMRECFVVVALKLCVRLLFCALYSRVKGDGA